MLALFAVSAVAGKEGTFLVTGTGSRAGRGIGVALWQSHITTGSYLKPRIIATNYQTGG